MAAVFRAAGFNAVWHPELIASTVLLGIVYLYVIGPLRDRFPGSTPVRTGQAATFLTALAVVYIAQGSPLALLSNEYLLSAHMVQMVLLYFVAAPLFIDGFPVWLFEALFRVAAIRAIVRYLTRPLRALGLFLFIFGVYLVPVLTEGALGNSWLYLLEHVLTEGAALALWWPLLSPLPEFRLADPTKLLYTFGVELGMTVPFALLTFASAPLYPTYAHAARVLPMSALTDQQVAGIIMRLGSMATLGVKLAQTFFRWAARESAASWPRPQAGTRP